MSQEFKWSISITLAGLTCIALSQVSSLLPHDGLKWYVAVTLVGVVGLAHVAYRKLVHD